MQNIFSSFVSADFPMTLVALSAAVLLIFVLLLIYTPMLLRYIFPEFGYKKYSEYLPFAGIVNDNKSVRLKSGEYICAYQFSGVQTSMQDNVTREAFLEMRASLFNQIQDTNVSFRFYTIRDSAEERTDYEFDQTVLQKIYDKWNSQGLRIFNNSYYIVLSASNLEKLNNYSNLLESILSSYKPTLLKHNAKNNIALLFGRILSPVSKPQILRTDGNMAEIAATDNVEFLRNGRVSYTGAGAKKLSVIASFKISPDFLDEEFFDEIATLQTEVISMSAFKPMGAAGVQQTIKQRQSTIDANAENQDVAEEQIAGAMLAMDENISGTQTMMNYYPMFQIFGDSEEELENHISNFKKICAGFGIAPVIEDFAVKVSFFAQLPGFDVFPRSFKLLSKASAISIPMSSVPTGVANSDWGPGALVIFPTAQGTPYQFQFHVSDAPTSVAHTLTIGPTGGGKTTLFSFLITQSLRHPKLKAFFFDRNHGAEVFTLATSGKYMTFAGKSKNAGEGVINFDTKMNPFKMEDSDENRAFLRRWLQMISGAADPDSLDEIARAVSVNFDYVDNSNRKLKNLWQPCFSSNGSMRGELKKWVDDLQYGQIFNEDKDTLDLYSRLTTFDFTDVMSDEVLAPAVVSYIIHRINSITVAQGTPSLIMIDETAPMLQNKMFRDNFIVGLQEGRKNRQAYMAAFQQANIIDKLGIGDVVRGQAQTVMFFRNPAADVRDYEYWKLNPLEMAFIQGKAYPHLKRAVLLSRPVNGESVILNTELGGLGNLLHLFESGRSSVLLAEELYKQFGNNFVEEYLKQQIRVDNE